jgi:hypothetical protein
MLDLELADMRFEAFAQARVVLLRPGERLIEIGQQRSHVGKRTRVARLRALEFLAQQADQLFEIVL